VSGHGSPLVIGGTGGSGTRVFAAIARAAGRDMGEHVNSSDDALEMMDFADRWLERFHAARLAGAPLPEAQAAAMSLEFEGAVGRHRTREGPWGWKQPRSIFFLPFLNETFPDLRFLHVVRDGRDVAFGRQAATVLENAADEILGLGWRFRPRPVALIQVWTIANELAADYGETAMGAAYLRVRFEDLCLDPLGVTAQVAEFAGAGPEAREATTEVARSIGWPRSIGLWRRADRETRDAVERAGDSALRRFGYADTRFRRPLRTVVRSATRRLRPS
jgi:hypothetical protein